MVDSDANTRRKAGSICWIYRCLQQSTGPAVRNILFADGFPSKPAHTRTTVRAILIEYLFHHNGSIIALTNSHPDSLKRILRVPADQIGVDYDAGKGSNSMLEELLPIRDESAA